MVSATCNGDDNFEGVKSTREDDGSIITRDIETGLARGGDTRAEALSQLMGVLALHEGGGELITDDDLGELGLGPDKFESRELPDFMQQMARRASSGREITKALTKYGYVPKSRHGSHVRPRYEHFKTGEIRNVDVPQHDELKIGTLRLIADQCGVKDLHS